MMKLVAKKQKQIDFGEAVLAEIADKQIKIKPRIYFVLANLLIVVATFFATLVGIFFFNLIVFKLRSLSDSGCLCWNSVVGHFWTQFPWLPLLITIIVGSLSWWLLRQFSWMERKKWLAVIAAVMVLSVMATLAADVTGLSEKMRGTPFCPIYCSLESTDCGSEDDEEGCVSGQLDNHADCGCDGD